MMFSTTPVNFSKIEAMMRSCSRSISPERELRQMTSHSCIRSAESKTHKSCAKMMNANNNDIEQNKHNLKDKFRKKELEEEEVEQQEFKAEQQEEDDASYRETFAVNDLSNFQLDDKKTETNLVSSCMVESEHNTLLVHNLESDNTPSPSSSLFSSEAVIKKKSRIKESSSSKFNNRCAGHIELTQQGENVVTPCVWHCGSILYYPVTCRFYCWNAHPLELRSECEQCTEVGVSCDFCGYTSWKEDVESNGDGVRGSNNNQVKIEKSSSKNNVELTSELKDRQLVRCTPVSSSPPISFYHCSTCSLDFCSMCIRDVANNIRFHVPCMQCQRCGEFVAINVSAIHKCKKQRKCEHYSHFNEQEEQEQRTSNVNKAVKRDYCNDSHTITTKEEQNQSEYSELENKAEKCNNDILLSSRQEEEFMKQLWRKSKPLVRSSRHGNKVAHHALSERNV